MTKDSKSKAVPDTEKSIETNRKRLLSEGFRRSDQAFCLICQKPVKLLTFLQTADFFEIDVSHVYRLSEKSELHLLHNRKGKVMVCGDSLFALLNQRQIMISNPRIITVKPLVGSETDENAKTEGNNH